MFVHSSEMTFLGLGFFIFYALLRKEGSVFHRLIVDCWNEKPFKRPTFRQIIKRLEDIYNQFSRKRKWKVCSRSLSLSLDISVCLASEVISVFLLQRLLTSLCNLVFCTGYQATKMFSED